MRRTVAEPARAGVVVLVSVLGLLSFDAVARANCAPLLSYARSEETRATRPRACLQPIAGDEARRGVQADLDAFARAAVRKRRMADAAAAWFCLFQLDPRGETAANLAVVLREQGELRRALDAARCAESLADSPDAVARARDRRADLERRLSPETAVRPEPVLGAEATRSDAPADPIARNGRLALVLGAVAASAAVGAVTSFVLASRRADSFQKEQQRSGYSGGARELRDGAKSWTLWAALGTGLALVSGGAAVYFALPE